MFQGKARGLPTYDPKLLSCDLRWMRRLNRYGRSLWHPNAEQRALRLQELQALLITLIRCTDNQYRIRSAAVICNLLDRSLELFVSVLHEIKKFFCAALLAQGFFAASINGNDAETHDTGRILHCQMTKSSAGTANDNPVTRLGAGFL